MAGSVVGLVFWCFVLLCFIFSGRLLGFLLCVELHFCFAFVLSLIGGAGFTGIDKRV